MGENEKKFCLVEIVLGTLFTLGLDTIALIADFLGLDIGWFIQIPAWLVFTLWFYFKGCRVTASFAKRFVIPTLVQYLPDWMLPLQLTILFLVTVYMENHPEKVGAPEAALGGAKWMKISAKT